MRICALLAAGWIAAAAPAIAEAPRPWLARSSLVAAGESQSRGIVFFLRVQAAGPGAAAVGSAAIFDRSELAGAERIEFRVGPAQHLVATSQALLTPPGWPASAGASPRSPHLVYALDAPPEGVSLLEAAEIDTPPAGTRVRVLALSEHDNQPEERFGTLRQVTPERFEIQLDHPAAARGWAGAPVLLAAQNRLLGTLEAGIPKQPTQTLSATPISFLVRELMHPLEHGAGRSFARFIAPALPVAPPGGKLIRAPEPQETRVQIDVSVPANASLVPPEICGIFVSGRARALGERRGFDVAIVIDTSLSTIEPTGADVNGNGVVGTPYLGSISSLFDAGSDDPGDSILAAEVAAARGLLWELDPRNTRVALITFAGELEPIPSRFWFPRRATPPAVTREPLTREFRRIERSLEQLLKTKPAGVTHMAAGVDQATRELLGQPGARSQADPNSEKVILFLTDGQPTLPYGPGKDAANVGAVLEAADRAHAAGIRVHSFAIGPEALAGPVATVELAARTGGYFIPVREPGDLADVVEAVDFPDLHDVVVRSETTGELAHPFHTDENGYFAGLVPATPGLNRIEIVARADDGATIRREIEVDLDPAAPPVQIPEELKARRTALLEVCLAELRDQRMQAEREQAERVRQKLIVEIERERKQARIRAAEQRKQLRLEVEQP